MMEALGLVKFNPDKLKPYLKMAVHRFEILNNKKTNLIKQEKRTIAQLLADEKEEKARIKVEHVIRQDFTIEAYEILELLCDLVHERMRLLVAEKECPDDMREAICTLLWSVNRTECAELGEVTKQFKLKYGKEFVEHAMGNVGGCVNERVMHKLSIQPPTAYLVREYLTTIAGEYNVDWVPTTVGISDEDMTANSMPAPSGFSVPVAPGSGVSSPYAAASVAAAPEPEFTAPAKKPPNDRGQSGGGGGGMYSHQDVSMDPTPPYSAGGGAADIPVVKATVVPDKPMEEAYVSPAVAPPEATADFVLPEVPSAPSGSGAASDLPSIDDMQSRLAGLSQQSKDKEDDNDNNGGMGAGEELPAAPGPAVAEPRTSDYNDLLSRFNNLKS